MATTPEDQPTGGGWKELDENPAVSDVSATGEPVGEKPANIKGGGRNIPWRAIVAGGALLAVLIFIFQNRDQAETNFLFVHGSQPLWFVIIISVVLGALLGWAVSMLRNRQKKQS